MRIVSLVPSLTDAVATLGRAEALVGVTRFCVHGAPDTAERVGGTKNPDVDRVITLEPDLVLANTEENRAEDLTRLRQAGLQVQEHHPRAVADVGPMLQRLGATLDADDAADALIADVETARRRAASRVPAPRVAAVTLIWRRPWMAVGPGTYADSLLWECGFANVLAGFGEPYPKLDPSFVLGADVALLPSEPYAFGAADHAAVHALVGEETRLVEVDGELLTWHGPRTAPALDAFSALAADLAERTD